MQKSKEGLGVFRFIMVMGSLSPLFLLWAIRGNSFISDFWFFLICGAAIFIPNFFILIRLLIARRRNDRRQLVVGQADDHRDNLFVYIFTILLPVYAVDISSARAIVAMCAVLIVVSLIFWRMNIHYLNLMFALMNYRIFTVFPHFEGNPYSGSQPFIVITRRGRILANEQILAYRISDSVYWEVDG